MDSAKDKAELRTECPIFQILSTEMVSPAYLSTFHFKRNAIHNRTINALVEFLNFLTQKKQKMIDKLGELSQMSATKVGILYFDDNSLNLEKLKMTFICRKILKLKVKQRNIKIYKILDKIDICSSLIYLFAQPQYKIPANSAVRINRSFFKMEYGKEFIQNKYRIKALLSKYREIQQFIESQPIPLWYSNFDKFFDLNIHKFISLMNTSLSYVQPFQFEQSISRAVFCSNNKRRQLIDNFLKLFPKSDILSDEFMNKMVTLCCDLVPSWHQKRGIEQSFSILVFYRLICDRFYEREDYLDMFHQTKVMENLMKLSEIPVKYFSLPDYFKFCNDREGNMPVRSYFQNDHFLNASAQFLNETIFFTNPLDMLYSIHRSLLIIHKVGIMRTIEYQATQDDISKLLSFDDLFSILVGVLLASDVPDIFAMAKFIDAFVPKHCLSNSFEYAHAGLTALVIHVRGIRTEDILNHKTE